MTEIDAKGIKDIEEFFGRPVSIPGEFARWMSDQFALAVPSIPITQLFGARSIERLFHVDTTALTASGGTEQTILTLPIPAKSVAQNGRLKVSIPLTLQDAAGAASAVFRTYLNGNLVNSLPTRAFFAAPDSAEFTVFVRNRDQYNSQIIESRIFFQKFWDPAAVDLSLDATLTVTSQFTPGGDANDILVRKAAFATLYNPSD